MFESLDERALLAQMCSAQRDERMAIAARILAAGRLCLLRMAGMDHTERMQWCIDSWEAVAAEVGAELGVSRGRASSAMNYGVELLERLPRLAAAFAAGEVEFRVVADAVFRTGLITEPDVLIAVDARLASCAPHWNSLSKKRLANLVDWIVSQLDPAAVRVPRRADDDRQVEFGEARDGMVEFWGTLRATDAAILDRRLDEVAAAASPEDTRTKAQRRADALVEMATASAPATSGQVVIHVLAEAATLSGKSATPGYVPGYGMVPPAMLRELAERAKLRPLASPALLCAEPRYRPSVALAEFVRCRDLTCRFPGCDKPAEVCDIDHTIPWDAGGPTRPSNLALLCRPHHLLKTFWSGEKGWHERQFPDGTIEWRAPSGRTYRTTPGGALFFPQLAVPTGTLTTVGRPPDPSAGRTLMMPTRRRSRAAERAARTQWERGLNEARWAADPPPF